jgi:hypothetical protein
MLSLTHAGLVIALLATGAAGMAGDADGVPDPFAWTPAATAAPFTGLLDEAAYAKRLAHWRQVVDLPALRASTRPSAGMEVLAVQPGGPAEQMGFKVGDVLSTLNGQPLRYSHDYVLRRGPYGGPLEIWTPAGGIRTVAIPAPPERIGFTFNGPFWYPELGYLRAGDCSDQWDVEAVAACLAFRQDPEFAVSALARVHTAGYRGSYLRAVQLCANVYRGFFRDALTGGLEAVAALPLSDRAEATQNLYVASLRSFHLPLAKEMLERFPEIGAEAAGFEPYLADHQSPAADRRGWTLAWPRPAGEPTFDLAGMATGSTPLDGDKTAMIRQVLSGRGRFHLQAPPRRAAQCRIDVPPVETLEVFLDVSLKSEGDDTFTEAFAVALGPPNLTPVFHGSQMPLLIQFNLQNRCALAPLGLPQAWTPIPFDDQDPGRIRMRLIIAHGQVTARLNGRVLCHVPVRGLDQPWSLHLGAKYLCAQIDGLKLTARGNAAPANWTPPETAPPPPPEKPAVPESANDF